MAGETYDELSGAVGHRATDMTLGGNGLLSFDLTRKFEEISSAYPYALGTMSLVVPTLTIESRYVDNAGPLAREFNCSGWTRDKTWHGHTAHHVYNAMSFVYENGSTLLQSRDLATDEFKALFPADALYLGTDYHYLSCEHSRFVIHSPDGVKYVFDATGAERTLHTRLRGTVENPKKQVYHKYTLRVVEKRRLTAKMQYTYEPMPRFRYTADGNPVSSVVGAPLRSPNSETWYQSGRFVTGHIAPYINGKVRLKSVKLRVDGVPDRTIDLSYRPSSRYTSCPGLIESATSNFTSQSRVTYHYRHYSDLASGEPRGVGIPQSGCVLDTVVRADGSTWKFDYGLAEEPQFTVDGVEVRYPASSTLVQYAGQNVGGKKRGDFYAYLPLRSVKVPTGALVTYEYMGTHTGRSVVEGGLGLCEYQDTARVRYSEIDFRLLWFGEYTTPEASCRREGSKVVARRPAVVSRTVSGSRIETAVTTIAYKRVLPTSTKIGKKTTTSYNYWVERWIQDGVRTTRLVFHRVNRVSNPSRTASKSKLMNSGKLKTLEIYQGNQSPANPPAPSRALVKVEYSYVEKNNAFKVRNAWYNEEKESSVRWWREANYRNMYAYDMRQVSLESKDITLDGNVMTTTYSDFDKYNNPLVMDEWGSGLTRRTTFGYDNNYRYKDVWFVKAPTWKKVEAGGGLHTYSTRHYNAKGLVWKSIADGVTTYYGHHADGSLSHVGSASVYTYFRDYVSGVPTKEYTGSSSFSTTRKVDDAGNVTEITDPEGRTTKFEYRPSDHALVKKTPPAPLGPTSFTPPKWHLDEFAYQREIAPGFSAYVYFDSLGRETLRRKISRRAVTKTVSHMTKYNISGQVTFLSDPAPYFVPLDIAGTNIDYDALGRVLRQRHSRDGAGVRICYGPACSLDSDFKGAGNVNFGYAVRDQAGYVSAYRFRAIGSPSNRELMEIRQEIRRTGETSTGGQYDRVLSTKIHRNRVGFVTAIRQGGAFSGEHPTRSYSPYLFSSGTTNFVTSMPGSETHPEFGTRTIKKRASDGRPIIVAEYGGAEYTYAYDAQRNLDTITQTKPGSNSLEAVGVRDYNYDKSNLLKSVSQNGTRWSYYYDDAGLLSQEQLLFLGEEHNQFLSLSYKRNTSGHVTQVGYPSGRRVDITRDGFGQAVVIPGFVDRATYHLDGQLETLRLANGTSQSVSLDDRLRPRTRIVNGPRGKILNQTTDYDERSNVTEISDYFAPSTTDLKDLSYDGLSRLLGAKGSWGTSKYVYDEIGNLGYVSIAGRGETYAYDDDNRLTSTFSGKNGVRSVDYDANGNIVRYGNRSYTFDGSNRLLTTVKHDPDDESESPSVLFRQENQYDGHGLRVRTTVDQTVEERVNGRTVYRPNTATTYFVYNRAGELMYEYDRESREQRDHIRLAGRTVAVIGRHRDHDTDGDGMPDYFERLHGLSTLLTSDANADTDGDGRTNLEEYRSGSSPRASDTDHDGVADTNDSDHVLPPLPPQPLVLEPIFSYLGG